MNAYHDVQVVIPSSGRPDRQITLQQLPGWLRPQVVVAVPDDELESYRRALPGHQILGVPCRGIAKTRHYLMDWCPTRFILMIDDDMTFAWRPSMEAAKLTSLQPGASRLSELFLYWRRLGEQYAHVGLSARQGNNHCDHEILTCCRMFNTYLYDLEVVRPLPVEAGRLPVMEDFDLTLQLLRLGYPNAVIYRWCWNQYQSNAPGGCSQYRTAEVQREAAEQLAALHPGLVRVVKKESKNWNGMHQRMDVVVSWKKAFRSSGVLNATVPNPGTE
jgi:hypothetical protein